MFQLFVLAPWRSGAHTNHRGVDGSRQIVDAQFDITGTGKNFQPLKTLINGQNVRPPAILIPIPR